MFLRQDVGEAHEFAGVSAFDWSTYKRLLKKDGAYECTIPITHIDPLMWAHRSIPPGQGGEQPMEIFRAQFHLKFVRACWAHVDVRNLGIDVCQTLA